MHKVKSEKPKAKSPIQNFKFYISICSFIFCVFYFTLTCFAQDKIVAIVNNDIITQKDLDGFINFMYVQLATEYKGKQLESKIQSMKSDLLDRLIEDRLILQAAKKNNLNIDENKVKAKIDEIRRRYPQDYGFQDALAKQGLVQADIELRIREQLLMYSIIDAKIRSKIVVNPLEVTDFYNKNIEEFKLSEMRDLEVISIKDENLANEVSNNLKNGQELSDLLKRYSLPINKLSVSKKGELNKDIEDVVFKLKPGEISKLIKIEDTFYIFKLDRIVGSRQQSLSEVQDKIYAYLFDNKMQEELTKWLDELKKNAYIKILSD